jgi:TonB family protein
MKRALLVWVCVVIMIVSGSAQSGEATLNAAIISAPRPDYPEQASVRHVAGCGLYQIDIDAKTGVPLRVEILQSAAHPLLNRAAVSGLMRWRAKPGGVRVVKIPVCFELRAGKPVVTYGNF